MQHWTKKFGNVVSVNPSINILMLVRKSISQLVFKLFKEVYLKQAPDALVNTYTDTLFQFGIQNE
jgi:hypothetical protein